METGICERATLGSVNAESARGIATFLARQSRDLGASDYLLLDAGGCIISCNWVYDAVAEVGLSAIAHRAESPVVIWPGKQMRGYHPLALAALSGREEIAVLPHYGHQEIVALTIAGGKNALSPPAFGGQAERDHQGCPFART